MKKIIATITTAALINAVVVLPAYASMTDDNQQKVTATPQNTDYQKMQQQQAQQQQQLQTAQQQFNTANTNNAEIRQTIYDSTTGQMITIVKNGYAISAYNSAGQQIPVQANWLNQINQTGTEAQQLATIASTIQVDASLNTVGKLVKALLAMTAVRANNQLMRQQYARQLAEQKQAKAQQTQQQTTTPQKDKTTAKKNAEQAEYTGYLREDNSTGGTAKSVNIANPGSTESQVNIDLISKIVNIDGNIITLQDDAGKRINVKVSDPEAYNIGDNLNATGNILSASDGNLYIVKDAESGMDVKVDKISDDSYNYKAQQQQQSTEDFVAQHPEANGLSGTGVGGAYYQAPPTERSSVSESVPAQQEETTIDEQQQPTETEYPATTSTEKGWFDRAKDSAQHLADNMTWGKAASLGGIAIGTAMMGTAIATSVASGGTALPLGAVLFKAGMSIAGAGVGTLAVQEVYQEGMERLHEKETTPIGSNSELGEYKEKFDQMNADVNAQFEAAKAQRQQ